MSKIERLKDYIAWLEDGHPIDKEECLGYLKDALADKQALWDYQKKDILIDHRDTLETTQFELNTGENRVFSKEELDYMEKDLALQKIPGMTDKLTMEEVISTLEEVVDDLKELACSQWNNTKTYVAQHCSNAVNHLHELCKGRDQWKTQEEALDNEEKRYLSQTEETSIFKNMTTEKLQRIAELSNIAVEIGMDRPTLAQAYKLEAAKEIRQEAGWSGPETDAKIIQSLLVQGYDKDKISAVISEESPEIIGKSPAEAFRYSLETANKVSAIQNIPIKNISEIFDEKIKENTVKIEQEKNDGTINHDMRILALRSENQELKNLKIMMDKVNNREYPIKIAGIVGIATPENVMAQRKEIGKQVSTIRSKEKETIQELDKDKGR